MEFYACGLNEHEELDLPTVCVRYHILGNNPCEHNNHCQTPEDPAYCPRMVTRMTRVLSAEKIRLIHSNTNCTILDQEGKLQIFGNRYGTYGLALSSKLRDRASEIVYIRSSDVSRYPLLLLDDGSFWTRFNSTDADFIESDLGPGQKILHLASGVSTMCVITKARPCTVVMLDPDLRPRPIIDDKTRKDEEGYESFREFRDSFDLPSPVKQLAVNFRYFTALTEKGEVYTWSSIHGPISLKEADSATAAVEQQVSASSEPSQSPPQDEGDDGPDMSALLDDLPITSPSGSPTLSNPRYSRVPLPSTTKISG